MNRLTLREVRHIYQIGGALEAAAFEAIFPAMDRETLGRMEAVQREVVERMGSGDYGLCPDRNIEFHELALGRCDNDALIAQIHLYPLPALRFPPEGPDLRPGLGGGPVLGAALGDPCACSGRGRPGDLGVFIREVHWNFEMHRDVLSAYYEDL